MRRVQHQVGAGGVVGRRVRDGAFDEKGFGGEAGICGVEDRCLAVRADGDDGIVVDRIDHLAEGDKDVAVPVQAGIARVAFATPLIFRHQVDAVAGIYGKMDHEGGIRMGVGRDQPCG
ncbi:MAG: hypothetical protein N0A15_15150, partial [Anaerolineae bacterium]|nr:hypothetical protein [Anaerolineae bacterium]